MKQDYLMISQLQELPGPFGNAFRLRFSAETLLGFISGLMLSFAFLSEKKNIRLRIIQNPSLASSLFNQCCFDADVLGEIFLNLMQISFRYASEGDIITVCTGVRHPDNAIPRLEIIITDTGTEIPKELLPLIYNHFEQMKQSGGHSTGASVTDHPDLTNLMELHNGTISVISRQDKGTRFRLRFPFGGSYNAAEPEIFANGLAGSPEIKPWAARVVDRKEAFMEKILKIMENNMANEYFSVDQFARNAGMSSSQLHRKFKGATGLSAIHFIRSARMHRAMELLERDAGNVAEIAYMVGYGDPSYFTRTFKTYFGNLPSEIKEKNKT